LHGYQFSFGGGLVKQLSDTNSICLDAGGGYRFVFEGEII
jgi:hypothetical protein